MKIELLSNTKNKDISISSEVFSKEFNESLVHQAVVSFMASSRQGSAKQKNPTCYFHYAYKFATRILAQMLDSLVRVSRRVEKNHLVNILEQEHFSLGLGRSTLKVQRTFHLDFQPPSHSYIAA